MQINKKRDATPLNEGNFSGQSIDAVCTFEETLSGRFLQGIFFLQIALNLLKCALFWSDAQMPSLSKRQPDSSLPLVQNFKKLLQFKGCCNSLLFCVNTTSVLHLFVKNSHEMEKKTLKRSKQTVKSLNQEYKSSISFRKNGVKNLFVVGGTPPPPLPFSIPQKGKPCSCYLLLLLIIIILDHYED